MTPVSPRSRWVIIAAAGALAAGVYLQQTGRLGGPSVARKLSPLLAAEREPGAYVVELLPGTNRDALREAIESSGLILRHHPSLLARHVLVTGSRDQLRRFARRNEVSYVFPASLELVSGEPLAACAGPIIEDEGEVGQYVKVGSGWRVHPPEGATVAYVFTSLTSRLPPNVVQAEVVRALEEWARYARIRFVPGEDPGAAQTISIKFAAGSHGDKYPFDGPGHMLAHTFFPAPPNSEPIAGDMHLDEEEDWGARTDLYTVALHEAGHALGLGHSDRPGAVMYPYYRAGLVLSDDDIAGIRALYGSRDEAPTAAPPGPAAFSLEITEPAGAVTTTAESIAVGGRVQNANGEIRLDWHTDRGASGHASGAAQWRIPAVPLSAGSNTITAAAQDAAGAMASRSVTVTRQALPPPASPPPSAPPPTPPAGADTTPPLLRITSPAATIFSTTGASITLRGTASDNVAVVEVTWTNAAGGSGSATGTANWTAEVPLQTGSNGITVRARDGAGNGSWRSITVVRR